MTELASSAATALLARARPPSGWDVGAYVLGLACLAKHAGLV